MKEELFILTDSSMERVDLNKPSGIQLNFKSYLFEDLSKITCSQSYTFKLPLTINNRRLFDFAEDIRHQSNMIRKRLTASYYQNGINLFQNAYLYIESIGTCYNAVMTWDVINGLAALKDNDISLRELPNNNIETMFGEVDIKDEASAFDNTVLVLHPLYNCGIPYFRWNVPYFKTTGRPNTSHYTSFHAYPMPVVPVYRLIQLINSHFNTNFKLGKELTIGNANNFDAMYEIVEKGVVPLVSKDLNYEQRKLRTCVLSGISFKYVNTTIKEENELYFPDVISFAQISNGLGDIFTPGSLNLAEHDKIGTTYNNVGIRTSIKNMSVEIDGCIHAKFQDFKRDTPINDDYPVLSIYQRQQIWFNTRDGGRSVVRSYYEWVELDSVDGVAIGKDGDYRIFEFDFAAINGAMRLSCENLKEKGGALLFVFSHRLNKIVSMQKDIEIFLENNDKCIAPHKIDVIGNLPDISCLSFMKSLFYMMGAFPYVNSNSEIIPRFFSEIKENLLSGNILDWSSKLSGAKSTSPNETKFSTSDFFQSNYYLMKSDNLDVKYDPEDLDDDVYDSGIGNIIVENPTLGKSKTIIQVPFFSPYIINRKYPKFETGNTIKCWTLSSSADAKERDTIYNRLEFCDAEPTIGIIKDRSTTKELNTGELVETGKVMTMEVWNGFQTITSNESYAYLQEIIRKPFVITEYMRLDEFDLLYIDYTRPIYLDKYNSYFAIISIQRDSIGKCKCELIKLP